MVYFAPEDGDAVARFEQREGTPVYFLRTAPGPDQCVVHSRDEAVAQVLTFAKRAKLRAWLMNEGDDSVLLEDFRVAQPPAEAPVRATMRVIEDVRDRLRAEFLEMPGLCLTLGQVQRLCGVERTICQPALEMLVAEAFLRAKEDGQYARLTDGYHPYPVKQNLQTAAQVRRAS
jgi:hypothetical protein